MTESPRYSVVHAGTPLTNLFKTFYSIENELLKVILNPYGLCSWSLYFLSYYLDNRKQTKKVNSSQSKFDEIHTGILQGSKRVQTSLKFTPVTSFMTLKRCVVLVMLMIIHVIVKTFDWLFYETILQNQK